MFDMWFPRHWPTLKKLIWLKVVALAQAVYATVTGAIATFTTLRSAPLRQLSVAVEPVQSGTGDPSPTNVRPITGWDSVNIWVQHTHDTTAEPTATIQLGETVYGGTLDVVNGKMTVDRAQIVLNGTQQANSFNWRPSETSVGVLFPYSLTNNFIPTSGAVPNGLISDKAISCSYNNQWDKIYDCSVGLAPNSSFGIALRIPDPTATTAALVNAYLSANPITVVYPLATPFELTLTPEQIATLQGTNNIWSDAGDVTVEYRAK